MVSELRLEREASFRVYFRMEPSQFDDVLSKVQDKIVKKDTHLRKAISPGERLAITLR